MQKSIDSFEEVILNQLCTNEEYFRTSIPFIDEDFFEDKGRKEVFKAFRAFTEKYNDRPNLDAMSIAINSAPLSDNEFADVKEELPQFFEKNGEFNNDWLIENTERWCRKRAFYNCVVKGSELLGKDTDDFYQTDLPEAMKAALAITFDKTVGMDYLEDFERRFEFYHQDIERFKFDLDILNKITGGGLPRKTLSVFMSTDTGGFKTGTMCHLAANFMMNGHNVLYITLEMAEERIAERIDANLLDVELDFIEDMPKAEYFKKSEKVRDRATGRLMVKEFPTSSAHAGHFRYLIKELQQKKNFKPDIIFIDYLNIALSSRLPPAAAQNTYNYVKSIAEEVRGLAGEFNCSIISGTQGNRDASGSSDISLSNTSESIGLPFTVDLFIGIISTEELDEQNQLMYKQLKNRFGPIDRYRTFMLNVNKAKMRLMDPESQSPLNNQTPSFGGESSSNAAKLFDPADVGRNTKSFDAFDFG